MKHYQANPGVYVSLLPREGAPPLLPSAVLDSPIESSRQTGCRLLHPGSGVSGMSYQCPMCGGWQSCWSPEIFGFPGGITTELAARLAEAERDARRYRWLRGDGGPQSLRWPRWSIQHWTGFWNPVQNAGMDAAIDAAMAADSASAVQEGE